MDGLTGRHHAHRLIAHVHLRYFFYQGAKSALTRPDQTRPDQARPDQTRPDQTRPDQLFPFTFCTYRYLIGQFASSDVSQHSQPFNLYKLVRMKDLNLIDEPHPIYLQYKVRHRRIFQKTIQLSFLRYLRSIRRLFWFWIDHK